MTTVYQPPPPMMQPFYGTSPNYGYGVPASGPPYGSQSQPNQQSSPLPPLSSNGNETMAPIGSMSDSAAPAQTLNNGSPPFPVAGPPEKY